MDVQNYQITAIVFFNFMSDGEGGGGGGLRFTQLD